MSETRAYLRVANPLATWGDWPDGDAAIAAHQLLAEDRRDWSLFLANGDHFGRMVLGAYHGWRTGRGPLHGVGYLAFDPAELALTEGEMQPTPKHYTYQWPPELADAHHDLVGHTPGGVRALLAAVALDSRLVRLTRIEVYVEEQRLVQRPDCVKAFAELARGRFKTLANLEPTIFQAVAVACAAAGVAPPAV